MSISITCPECTKALKVKDEWAGRRATCPQCRTAFHVPVASALSTGQAPVAQRATTAYNPAVAEANRLKRQREEQRQRNLEDGEKHLPWQFVLLGFLVFPWIIALLVLAQTFGPADGKRATNNKTMQQITIPYLLGVVVLAPFLIKSGFRRYEKANAEPRPPISPAKRLVIAAITFAAGVMMLKFAQPPTSYVSGCGLIGAALGSAISAMMMER